MNPRLRELAAGVLLGALGFMANWYKVSLFINVEFLFGSVFSMLAVLRFGPAAGLLAAVIASSCTWFHWHHPWGMVIMCCEVLCAGWLMKRRHLDLMVGDIIFWFSGGMLLVWLFYHQVLDLSTGATLLMALKQGFNGILNALLAESLHMFYGQLSRDPVLPSLRKRLRITLQVLLIVPAFCLAFGEIDWQFQRQMLLLQQNTVRMADVGKLALSSWMTEEQHMVKTLAHLVGDPVYTPQKDMQRLLEKYHEVHKDTFRFGVIDRNYVTRAFSPPRDEFGKPTVGVQLGDRPYIGNLKDPRHPLVFDAFMGRLGVPGPRLIMLAPCVVDGEYSGTAFSVITLKKPNELLKGITGGQYVQLTLLDGQRRVLASTNPERKFLTTYTLPPAGRLTPTGEGVFQWIPDPRPGVNALKRWSSSFYMTEVQLAADEHFRLVVESSLAPQISYISSHTTILLGGLAMMALLVIGLTRYFSNRLLGPISALGRISSQLPDRIARGERIIWRPAKVMEEQELQDNFRSMEHALEQSFRDLTAANSRLEERVAERTAELLHAQEQLADKQVQLVLLNRSLQQRVDISVAELRQKDQILISQGRQAAMGEMIGNIAHQWRQPLNALSMVVANIQSAFQHHELTDEYLDKAGATANRLIQKMSTTINDFRNFFKPDKQVVTFSTLEQVNHAVALIEAGLKSQNITLVLDAPRDFMLNGFPNEYSQLLLNLLSNAKDAIMESQNRAGTISIRLYEQDGYGCVAVRDNGGGIPAGVLDRIFEPYFSTKSMGTGIGLYMSKMIIERSMNGRIEVNNSDGGAEFIVVTPLGGSLT